MIHIKRYSIENNDIWNSFVKNSKNGTFMLNRNYMDYHSDRFHDFSLMFYEEDELVAIMPASLHGDEISSHGGLTYGGIIVNSSMKQHRMLECFDILKIYLKQNGIKSLIYKTIPYIYHKQPSQEDLYALFINNADLYRRDISSAINLKEQLKMTKGRKAQISRAKREGVGIIETDDFESFIDLENKILKKYHNTKAVHSAEELRKLKNSFNNEIQLWVAKLNNKITAGVLLYITDKVVHTQYMAADDISREIGGLDLLIKTLIDKFSQEKDYFDFGISTENNGLLLNTGLISQKEGFGGRGVVYDFYKLNI